MNRLEAFDEKWTPEPNSGCWLWTASTMKNGYGRFGLPRDGHKFTELAHRASLKLRGTDVPDDAVVMHTCDTPACVNPQHLRLGTQKDNIQDASRKGRMVSPKPVGTDNARAALSLEQHAEMLALLYSGYTRAEVARYFRVSWQTANNYSRRPLTPAAKSANVGPKGR